MQREFAEQRDATVRALSGMVFSWEQNGHLMLNRGDVDYLVSAVELLNRAKAKGVNLWPKPSL